MGCISSMPINYFKGNIPWRKGVWIEVVFDDFSDLKETECPTS